MFEIKLSFSILFCLLLFIGLGLVILYDNAFEKGYKKGTQDTINRHIRKS